LSDKHLQLAFQFFLLQVEVVICKLLWKGQ